MSDNFLVRKRNEAVAYYDMKRYEQAAQAFKEILAVEPQDAFSLYLLANCCFMLDNHDEAEMLCKDLITTYLADDAFMLLGKIYRSDKKYRKAEEFFLKALEIDPQKPDALAEYAYLLLLCGYRKKAEEVMREAERLDPEDTIVLHYKFYFQHTLGSRKQELTAIKNYYLNSSDEVHKLVKLGYSDYKNNRFKSSREYFRQAFVLEPTNRHILEMLQELDRINHFVFFPNRFFSRLHPIARFVGIPIGLTVIPIILLVLGFESTGPIVFAVSFGGIILLNAWSLLSDKIYRRFIKKI